MIHILVADDEPMIRRFVQDLLEDEGYVVHTAVGRDVLPTAQAVQPALILLDVNMPGLDGITVARHLRADPRTRHIPIVLMSAMHQLQQRAQGVQVERVLPKPFALSTLLACVADLAGPPQRTSDGKGGA